MCRTTGNVLERARGLTDHTEVKEVPKTDMQTKFGVESIVINNFKN
jgi:hypothetical protein